MISYLIFIYNFYKNLKLNKKKKVMQFGIALPKWIVDGKNSYLVLGAYILVFMIIMPTIVVSFALFTLINFKNKIRFIQK